MNKERYIKELDALNAPEELKERISTFPEKKPHKRNTVKALAVVAACLVFIIVAVPAMNTMAPKSADKSFSYSSNNAPQEQYQGGGESEINESISESPSLKNKTEGSSPLDENRKIIKTANIDITVKNLDKFLSDIKASVDSLGGYISAENQESNQYNDYRNSEITIRVPAEKFDSFINGTETFGTVTSKNITSNDETSNYVDIESKMKSLETEQKALMNLLEKADSLDNIIQLQNRLSEIRGEIESYKSQLKLIDSQVDYSTVTIYASEQERVIKTDGSFGSQVKEKFLNSLFSIGDFFESFAINFLGAIPYIVIVAVIAVIVIVIVKKKKNKKGE